MITGKNLPKEVIDKWPEVFGEVTLNAIPLCYLYAVKIKFKNHKIWEIEIKEIQKGGGWNYLETQIKGVVADYESEIDNIDFQLDTVKLKKDVLNHTKKFLKNRKLK